MIDKRYPTRIATIRMYLFGRVLRRMAREAEAELAARGIPRDSRIPVLDQLAEGDLARPSAVIHTSLD